MADSVRCILMGVVRGMWDSVAGIMKIYRMNKESKELDQEVSDQPDSEFTTVLAQRRAHRGKSRQTRKESKEPKILQRILICCAWNGGIFLMSILAFRWILMPFLEFFTHLLFGGSETHNTIWSYMGPTLTWTFNTLWILPLFVLSKIVNTLWFQDIADTAYRKSRGRPQLPSVSRIIADILFNLVIQSLFLIQGMMCMFLPIHSIGQVIYMLHMCFIYSLYAFEYKWFNMGWELPRRLKFLEINWPYFTGFGLPLAVLTSMPQSYVISGCVFSILFPLFIISANEAKPLENTGVFPLKLFSVAAQITNSVFMTLKKKSTPKDTSKDTS